MTRPSKATGKPLTPAVLHVLLALSGGPLHGYGVMQQARTTAEKGDSMGPSTIYGTLQRLLDLGWVREIDPATEGIRDDCGSARPGRPRRWFQLSEDGRRALAAESRRLLRLADLVREKQLVPGTGQ